MQDLRCAMQLQGLSKRGHFQTSAGKGYRHEEGVKSFKLKAKAQRYFMYQSVNLKQGTWIAPTIKTVL